MRQLSALPRPSVFLPLLLVVALTLAWPFRMAEAADRARIEAFLNVTGFDVALDSIAESAESAPRMLGFEAQDFGIEWTRMAGKVFDTKVMRTMALDILEQTLDDSMLNVAVDFYASDLGQRLVAVENESHGTDDEMKRTEGARLVAEMVKSGDPRLELYKRMGAAIGGAEAGLRAYQEIQVRFLLAASAAGVIDLKVDIDELRAMMKTREGEVLRAIRESSLAASAYTYRDFAVAELTEYTEALEGPEMRKVYELLNAVQFEITANRFEELARQMADLQPQQSL